MFTFLESWNAVKSRHHATQLYSDYLIPTEDDTFVVKNGLIDYSDFLCQPEQQLQYANRIYKNYQYYTIVTVGDGAEYDYDNITDAIDFIDAEEQTGHIHLYKDTSEVINQDVNRQITIYGFDNPALSGGRTAYVSGENRYVYIYNCKITGAMYWDNTRFHYCNIVNMTATETPESLVFDNAYWCYFADIICGDGIGLATREAGTIEGNSQNCRFEDITIGGNATLNGLYLFQNAKNCIFGDFTFKKPASEVAGDGGYGAWICEDMKDCKWTGTWNFQSNKNSVGTNIQFLNNAQRCVFEGTFNFAIGGTENGCIGSPRSGYVLHGAEECTIGGTWNFANGNIGVLSGTSPNTHISPLSTGGGGFGYGADGSGSPGGEGGYRDCTFPGTFNFGIGGAAISADNNSSPKAGDGGFSGGQNGDNDGGRDLYWYSNVGASCPVSAGSGGVIKNNKDSTFTTGLSVQNNIYATRPYDKSLENFRKLRLTCVLTGSVDFDVSTTATYTTPTADASIKLETDGHYYLIYTGALSDSESKTVEVDVSYDGLTNTSGYMRFRNNIYASVSAYYYDSGSFYGIANISGYHMNTWGWNNGEMGWRNYTIKTMAFDIEASDNCEWSFDYPYSNPYNYYPAIFGKSTDGNEITLTFTYTYECEGEEYTVEKELNWTPA